MLTVQFTEIHKYENICIHHNMIQVIRHANEKKEVHPDTCRRQIISNKAEFEHAVKHTFCHEWSLSMAEPSFWNDNRHKFPCRYDHHTFSGPIFSYPIAYKDGKWTVRNVFCSPHCAKKYLSTQKNIPSRCYTLFALMMRVVYQWEGDVVPASDIDLTMNPLEPMSLETWRQIPKQHVQVRLTMPESVPFRMENMNVVSHPMPTHKAYEDIKQWNSTMAEPGPLPDDIITMEEIQLAAIHEDNEEEGEGEGEIVNRNEECKTNKVVAANKEAVDQDNNHKAKRSRKRAI
jgi:hypothetical protein